MLSVHKAIHKWLVPLLPTDYSQGATFQSCGGKGAGSFLLPPQAGEEPTRLSDVRLRTILRLRQPRLRTVLSL